MSGGGAWAHNGKPVEVVDVPWPLALPDEVIALGGDVGRQCNRISMHRHPPTIEVSLRDALDERVRTLSREAGRPLRRR